MLVWKERWLNFERTFLNLLTRCSLGTPLLCCIIPEHFQLQVVAQKNILFKSVPPFPSTAHHHKKLHFFPFFTVITLASGCCIENKIVTHLPFIMHWSSVASLPTFFESLPPLLQYLLILAPSDEHQGKLWPHWRLLMCSLSFTFYLCHHSDSLSVYPFS